MIRTALSSALAALAMLTALSAQAQSASAPVSAAKKEMVAKVLKLQQPAIEAFARNVVQQNAAQVMQAAANAMQQRVAPDRREAIWVDMQADARKFSEEAFPIVREKAVKLAPATMGPALEERFSDDELKQLLVILESPVGRKFAQMNGELLRILAEKLMAEVRPLVDPKLQTFQKSVAARLAPAASTPGTGK